VTCHAPRTDDPDKAVCGVRFSQNPERVKATTPISLTCDLCSTRVYGAQRLAGLTEWPPGVAGVPKDAP
jgi:hypothetical protein